MEKYVDHEGVISSTHLDRQMERITKAALEDGARQINEHGLWTTVHHDPTIPPIGRCEKAEVRPRADGEYELFVRGCLWKPESYPTTDEFIPEPRWDEAKALARKLQPENAGAQVPALLVEYDPHGHDQADVNELVDSLKTTFQVRTETLMMKSVEAPAILLIGLGVPFTFFAKGYFTELGKIAARGTAKKAQEAYHSLRQAISGLVVRSKPNHPPMLGLRIELPLADKSVLIEGYARPQSENEAAEALDHAAELWAYGTACVLGAKGPGIERIVFLWDPEAHGWSLQYIVTEDHTVVVHPNLKPLLTEIIHKVAGDRAAKK